MSDFKELIKTFDKSREYVRDFFVYGFKTRDEFRDKSGRTYDNERRRIESWLAGFVKRDYTAKGKNISLAIDSNLLDTNPLNRVWKTKSFTDNDIMLHFYLLDYLDENDGDTAEEITDGLLSNYGILFDAQLVRRKCNEYEKEGLLRKEKRGRELVYCKNSSFQKMIQEYPGLLDAMKYYQITAPLGVLGSTILDNVSEENKLFRVKHSFFVHTLEDEMLLEILGAMREKRSIEIMIRSTKNGREQTTIGLPLQIFTSTRTGRRFLCIYYENSKRFFCIRLDYIKKVKLLKISLIYDDIRQMLHKNRGYVWGVSFQNASHSHLQHIKITFSIDEESETFILNRLKREGKGGTTKKIAENTFTYENAVFDVNEMMPWIRTFIGRIIDIETNHPKLNGMFERDMNAVYKMYGITSDNET